MELQVDGRALKGDFLRLAKLVRVAGTCKGIVEMHGGHIEAHSAGLESGSAFRVRLPRSSVRLASGKEDLLAGGAQAAGFDQHPTKPVDPALLEAMLAQLVKETANHDGVAAGAQPRAL